MKKEKNEKTKKQKKQKAIKMGIKIIKRMRIEEDRQKTSKGA